MQTTSELAGAVRDQAAALGRVITRLGDAEIAGLELVMIVRDRDGTRVVGEALDATREVIRELDRIRGGLLGISYRHERQEATR